MSDNNETSSIFIKIRAALSRAVYGIVPPSEVEDIVQETYVRACQARKTGSISEPQAYLFRVARNLALDHAKRAETRLTVVASQLADEEDFESVQPSNHDIYDQAVSNEEFGEFCEAIRELPKQQRRAFVLKKVYGFTQKEIAVQMDLSEKTVERHIALAMEKCIEFLKNDQGRASPTSSNRHGAKVKSQSSVKRSVE